MSRNPPIYHGIGCRRQTAIAQPSVREARTPDAEANDQRCTTSRSSSAQCIEEQALSHRYTHVKLIIRGVELLAALDEQRQDAEGDGCDGDRACLPGREDCAHGDSNVKPPPTKQLGADACHAAVPDATEFDMTKFKQVTLDRCMKSYARSPVSRGRLQRSLFAGGKTKG